MQFSWLNLLLAFAAQSPNIVTAIEALHQGKSGADKKQAALAIAGLSAQSVMMAAPNQAPIISASATLVGSIIDATVADKNASGAFQHSSAAATSQK